MSDMRMIDNEEQRDDRKKMPKVKAGDTVQAGQEVDVSGMLDQPDAHRYPNRRQRRLIARKRGVFKHPGAWPYINEGAKKNISQQRSHEDDHQA